MDVINRFISNVKKDLNIISYKIDNTIPDGYASIIYLLTLLFVFIICLYNKPFWSYVLLLLLIFVFLTIYTNKDFTKINIMKIILNVTIKPICLLLLIVEKSFTPLLNKFSFENLLVFLLIIGILAFIIFICFIILNNKMKCKYDLNKIKEQNEDNFNNDNLSTTGDNECTKLDLDKCYSLEDLQPCLNQMKNIINPNTKELEKSNCSYCLDYSYDNNFKCDENTFKETCENASKCKWSEIHQKCQYSCDSYNNLDNQDEYCNNLPKDTCNIDPLCTYDDDNTTCNSKYNNKEECQTDCKKPKTDKDEPSKPDDKRMCLLQCDKYRESSWFSKKLWPSLTKKSLCDDDNNCNYDADNETCNNKQFNNSKRLCLDDERDNDDNYKDNTEYCNELISGKDDTQKEDLCNKDEKKQCAYINKQCLPHTSITCKSKDYCNKELDVKYCHQMPDFDTYKAVYIILYILSLIIIYIYYRLDCISNKSFVLIILIVNILCLALFIFLQNIGVSSDMDKPEPKTKSSVDNVEYS
jgi:hypothetical protein